MFGRSARAWTVASLALATGCGSLTTYQSADTLPPGQWQVMVAADTGVYRDDEQQTRTPTATGELGVRRGIAEHTDIGLKLYGVGIEASVRHRIATGTWSWALLGAIGGVQLAERAAVSASALGQLRVGAVATQRRSPKLSWSIGPSVTGSLFVPAGGGHATGLLVGGFVGLDRRLGASWHFIPELSLHRTVAGDVPVQGAVAMLGAALAKDF
jgi:hypothetical protein